MESHNENAPGPRTEPGSPQRREETGYEYASAGIREREGSVPTWLILVIIGLAVWAIYYLLAYWTPPGS